MIENQEMKENNQNIINMKTVFGNLLNEKPDKKPLNIKKIMKNESKEIKKLLNKGISSDLIKRKPSPLKLLEKQMSNFYFGINGRLTYLIPNLQNELIEKEKKQNKILNEKIPIGDLTFLQNNNYDDFKKIKQKEENKDFLMKSSNFQKNNYNQIKEKYNKNHKKVYSQITPELNIEELSMNYIKYPLSNKNKINDFILTVNKFNPHSDNIKYKINNKNQNNKNDNKKSSIFNKENLESPLLNKEINLNQTNTNSLSSFSKVKNSEKQNTNSLSSISKVKNSEKQNTNSLSSFSKVKDSDKQNTNSSKNVDKFQINSLTTTSVNSLSYNSQTNGISTFKFSKSSIKNSSFSSNQINNNNNETGISNSFYLKNAIANIKFDINNKKNNTKKNQINLLRVSNSEKKLLIPEYSVEKPFILNSYFNFNKNNNNDSCDFPKILNDKNLSCNNNKRNSFNQVKKSFNNKNRSELNHKIDKIFSNEKKISKALHKIINKNKINKKIHKLLNKKKNNDTIIKQDIGKFKLILEDNFKKEKTVKLLKTERIENDNKLIDATKKLSDDAIVPVLENANINLNNRNKNLDFNFSKTEKYEIWKEKYVANNSKKIERLNAVLVKEKNKVIEMIDKNLNNEEQKYNKSFNIEKKKKIKLNLKKNFVKLKNN